MSDSTPTSLINVVLFFFVRLCLAVRLISHPPVVYEILLLVTVSFPEIQGARANVCRPFRLEVCISNEPIRCLSLVLMSFSADSLLLHTMNEPRPHLVPPQSPFHCLTDEYFKLSTAISAIWTKLLTKNHHHDIDIPDECN